MKTLKQKIDQVFDELELALRVSSCSSAEAEEGLARLQERHEQLAFVLSETAAPDGPPRFQLVDAKKMDELWELLDELESEHAIQDSYGYPKDDDPRLFTPDPDTTLPEALAAHAAAVASANAGEPIPELPPAWREPTFVPTDANMPGAVLLGFDTPDGTIIHSHFGGWGMGISTWHDDELLELIERMRLALRGISPEPKDA